MLYFNTIRTLLQRGELEFWRQIEVFSVKFQLSAKKMLAFEK